MLKRIEGAIKDGQTRDTCTIGHKTQNKDKQSKNTTHKTEKISNIKPGMNPNKPWLKYCNNVH
jgi:hypothetical protein